MHLVDVPAFFLTREIILYLPVCFSVSLSLFEKWSTLKGKKMLPLGTSSFFPFRVDPFPEWKTVLTELSPLNVYQFALILYFTCSKS